MRVAVTGATGFVGGAAVRALAEAGHQVLALGRAPKPSPTLADGVAYASWDLAVPGPSPAALPEVDAVVHAAARVEPWGPDAAFLATNVEGTARLVDAIPPTARLVVIGSASVYDPRSTWREARENEAPVDPRRYLNAYGVTKAAQEHLVLARRPDAVTLRPRIVWGPGDRTLFPRLIARLRGDRLLLPGGGRAPVSMTHIDSLVAAVLAALARWDVRGPVNVADATPVAPAGLLSAVFEAADRPLRIVPIPAPAAEAAALVVETAWRAARRVDEPPLTRYAVAAFTRPLVLDLHRLHDELGIAPDADLPRLAGQVAASLSPRPVLDVQPSGRHP